VPALAPERGARCESLVLVPSSILRGPRVAAALWRLRSGRLAAASLNVLNRCNQACPMCEVHASEDHAFPLPRLARAARALRAAGVRIVEISGGEPFLRPDLPDVLRLLDDERLLFTFNTNGTALTDAGVEALRRARGLLQVAVSLDSLDRERYRLLRGRDLLARALDGIERLRAARLPCPLKLNFAMSRHNDGETPALLALAARRGLFLSVFPVNQGPGAHRSACGLFAATPEERARMARRFEGLAALRREGGAPLWEPSRFYSIAAAFLRGEPLEPCGAGRLYLDVRADGSIAPCIDLPAVGTVDDLVEGRAADALQAAQDAVAACRAATPCCYTCTVSLAETGRRPAAYALETLRVLWSARARRTAGEAE
jgi:MoaA/NifB/PqqE/SkfB family radical SAM enzyme